MRTAFLLPALMLAANLAAAAPPSPGTAMFFGLHFIDTSTEGAINGVREDETARLKLMEAQLRGDLTARGFTLMDPPADEVASVKNPTHCNGCDTRMAEAAGADYAISGEVQKVSNLILSMNLYVRDAETGRGVAAGAVDIRGNTDESWSRGYRYLLKNLIFKGAPQP